MTGSPKEANALGCGTSHLSYATLFHVASAESPIYSHRRACYRFGDVVGQVGTRWDGPSPCPDWTARGVLEHVIGFHEVLLLRPVGAAAHRPKDNIPGRWAATETVIFAVLDANWGRPIDLPDGSTHDVEQLLPMLTTDVLVHTWDLGKAIGINVTLDPDLTERALSSCLANEGAVRSSGMYEAAVQVPPDVSAQSQLLALLGRDPSW